MSDAKRSGGGFAREGLLRPHRLCHGQPVDMVVMGILDEEYRAANDRSAVE